MSYDTLAERSTFSRRAVINFAKELEAGGWITIHRTGGRRANTFALSLPPPLQFPDDETRQLADTDENKAANLRESGSDNKAKRGKFASFPDDRNGDQDEGEQCTVSDTATVNGARTGALLMGAEQCTSSCTDADEQQCTEATPTVNELVHPKRRKEFIPYNPLTAQPTTEGVSCDPSGASSKLPAKPPTLVFVEYGTTAAMAWERHSLKMKRKRPPWQCMPEQGFRRGWFFPSEFPPEDAT